MSKVILQVASLGAVSAQLASMQAKAELAKKAVNSTISGLDMDVKTKENILSSLGAVDNCLNALHMLSGDFKHVFDEATSEIIQADHMNGETTSSIIDSIREAAKSNPNTSSFFINNAINKILGIAGLFIPGLTGVTIGIKTILSIISGLGKESDGETTVTPGGETSGGNSVDTVPQETPSVGSYSNNVSVDVPLNGQHTNYTCGSASGTMILNSLGINTSEEDFWQYANSGGQGTYVYRVAQTLNHFAGSDVYHYTDTNGMSIDAYYDTIQNSISNGYPVEVVAKFTADSAFGYKTDGHYVVVTGVYQNSSGEYIAKINDPYSSGWGSNGHQGQQIEVKLADLQQYNKNHSGFIINH